MAGHNLVTVYRTNDEDGDTRATFVRNLLRQSGLNADIFDESAPGVDEDTWEVRVPGGEVDEAKEILEAQRDFSPEPADISHDLDMVPVFVSEAHNAEMLATEIRSILEAHGIPSVLVTAGPFPNLPFEVRVPKTHLDDARRAIAAAAEAGPSAAEEAERESEMTGGSEGEI